MRHRDLWVLITESLEEFQTELQLAAASALRIPPTPEDFIADVMSNHANMSADEMSFVRECFLGVLRYERVCEGILQGFCNALKRNKQERYSMYLIAYLFVYRFAEVTGRFMRSLVDKCTSATRLAEYIGFLLDREKMMQFAGPELRQWYHDGYVENVVIGNLQKHRVEAERDVLQHYVLKATNPSLAQTITGNDAVHQDDVPVVLDATQPRSVAESSPPRSVTTKTTATVRSNKPLTTPKAPNLSEGRVRARDVSLKQMPPFEVREMLQTVPLEKPPHVVVPPDGVVPLDGPRPPRAPSTRKDAPFIETERPMHRDRLQAEKEAREAAELLPDPVMQNRLLPEEIRGKLRSDAPKVKQTTASIRREELLYRRRDEAKEQELLRKAQEMRDDNEYQRWREAQEEAARIERESSIAERKLLMMLSDEEAKAARIRTEQQNAVQAAEFRRMMNAWRQAAAEDESAERRRKLDFAEALRNEVQENTEAAKRQVQQERRLAASRVKAETQENEIRTAVAMELERQRKSALIAEIRKVAQQTLALRPESIEKCRASRLNELGVADTMSIEELKQQLAAIRAEHDELEARRRDCIISNRTQQRADIDRMAARCEFERMQYLDEKERDRERRRTQAAEQAEKLRVTEEARLIELQAKLQQKREERKAVLDKRKEEERQRKVEAMLLAGDAGAVEMKRWAEMERGVSNRIAHGQNQRLRELKQDRSKQSMLQQQRESNIVSAVTARRRANETSDRNAAEKRSIMQDDDAYDESYRLAAIAEMKQERASMRTRTA